MGCFSFYGLLNMYTTYVICRYQYDGQTYIFNSCEEITKLCYTNVACADSIVKSGKARLTSLMDDITVSGIHLVQQGISRSCSMPALLN